MATWFNSSTTGTATFAHGGEMQPAGFIRNMFNEKLSEWSGRQKVFPTSPVRTACSHIASPIVQKKAGAHAVDMNLFRCLVVGQALTSIDSLCTSVKSWCSRICYQQALAIIWGNANLLLHSCEVAFDEASNPHSSSLRTAKQSRWATDGIKWVHDSIWGLRLTTMNWLVYR